MCKECDLSYIEDIVERAVKAGNMEDIVRSVDKLHAAALKHQVLEGFSGYGGASSVFPYYLDTKESLENILRKTRECKKSVVSALQYSKHKQIIDSLIDLEFLVMAYINQCKVKITQYLF